MIRLDLSWMDNKDYLVSEYGGLLIKPREDAPQEVKDSYTRYLKQKKEAINREKKEKIVLI